MKGEALLKRKPTLEGVQKDSPPTCLWLVRDIASPMKKRNPPKSVSLLDQAWADHAKKTGERRPMLTAPIGGERLVEKVFQGARIQYVEKA